MVLTSRACTATLALALTLSIGTVDEAMAQSVTNQSSVFTYITTICPKMREQFNSLSPSQKELFFRCRAVANQTDSDADVSKALGQITSDELLAQDAAIRGAAQPQSVAIAARLNAMSHFSTQSAVTAFQVTPIRFASNDAVRTDGPVDYGVDGPQKLQFFSSFNYSGGNRDATPEENGFDMDFVSVVAGADYRVSPRLLVGAALGYGNTKLNFLADDGNLKSDAYTAALYAVFQPSTRIEISVLAAYSRINYDGIRNFQYDLAYTLPGQQPTVDTVRGDATSRSHANQREVTANAFYNMGNGAWTVGPVLQMSSSRLSISAFKENSQSGLGFAFPKQISDSLLVSVGFDASKAISQRWGVLSPYVRARAVFETSDRQRTVKMFYVNDPFVGTSNSPGATLTTSPTDRTRFTLGGGIAADLPHGVALTIDGQVLIGMRDVTQYGMLVGVRFAI